MNIEKQIIDQKPRSDWRLIIETDNSQEIPYQHYQIQFRRKFLWWKWWVGRDWFKGIKTRFALLNRDHSVDDDYIDRENEKISNRTTHSLKVLRDEVIRYYSQILDQRD